MYYRVNQMHRDDFGLLFLIILNRITIFSAIGITLFKEMVQNFLEERYDNVTSRIFEMETDKGIDDGNTTVLRLFEM